MDVQDSREIKIKYKGADSKIDELKKKGAQQYKDLKAIFILVNTGNTIGRNRLCLCKSGKKWKYCCIKKHEAQVLVMEKLREDYGQTIKEVKKLMKEKGV